MGLGRMAQLCRIWGDLLPRSRMDRSPRSQAIKNTWQIDAGRAGAAPGRVRLQQRKYSAVKSSKTGSLLSSLLIDFESSRHQVLKLVNPGLVGRMSRHQFRRFGTLTCRHHPFPESQ